MKRVTGIIKPTSVNRPNVEKMEIWLKEGKRCKGGNIAKSRDGSTVRYGTQVRYGTLHFSAKSTVR